MHLKMYTPLISRLRIMNREFMSLMKGRLLQLRRIRDFGGEELRFSFIRQRLTRTAAKCCMSSIRSEDRTTSAASGQSRSLPMNTEASVLKDRNSIIEKRLFPGEKPLRMPASRLSGAVSRMNDARPDFSPGTDVRTRTCQNAFPLNGRRGHK